MSDDQSKARICRACGKDCTGQPRIKDKKGRYLHKACYEKAKARQTAALQTEEEFDGLNELGDGLGEGVLAEIQPVHANTRSCPDCGFASSAAAVLCTGCGYNFASEQSGADATVTKPSKMAGAAEGAAGKFRSTISSGAMGWIITLGLPLVVGLVCSGVWAWFTVSSGLLSGITIIGIGALVGVTMKFVSGGGGFVAGFLAAALTVASMSLGIFFVEQITRGESVFEVTNDPLANVIYANDAKFYLADWIAYEREEDGDTLDWPTGKHFYTAEELTDFPKDVLAEASRRWNQMEGYEQHETRANTLFSEHDAIMFEAEQIVGERYQSGQEVNWPDLGVPEAIAYYPRDYPQDIWTEATAKWDAMPPNQQQDLISKSRREINEFYQSLDDGAELLGTTGRGAYRFMRSIAVAAFLAFIIVFRD